MTFTCPRCSRVASVNIPEDFHQNNSMEIECQCECGYQFKQEVERRRHSRKAVKFSGWYNYCNEIQLEPGVVAGKFVGKGKMTVVDLSVSGFKVKLKKKEDLKVNDRLQVEFYLKDYKHTLIRKPPPLKTFTKNMLAAPFCRLVQRVGTWGSIYWDRPGSIRSRFSKERTTMTVQVA